MSSQRQQATIAVFNQKGGVGKTTTCLNLTAALHRGRRRPVAIDLDPQGHLGLSCGVKTLPGSGIAQFFEQKTPLSHLTQKTPLGWDVIGTSFDLAKVEARVGRDPLASTTLLSGIENDKGLPDGPLLIDCSPTLGGLTLNAMVASDRVLIPVVADFLSMQGVHRVYTILGILERNLNRRIDRRIVLTRFDPRKKLSFDILEQLQRKYGGQVCQTRIEDDESVARSPMYAMDVFSHDMQSKGAKEYRDLAVELARGGFFDRLRRGG